MKVAEGLPYAPAAWKRLTLDLAEPRERRSGLLLVLIHGGGWDKGDKDAMRPELEHFARAGYPAASIEYRLSGDATFPAPWQDVRAAMRFLRPHGDRLVLIGHSAGGHLAALAGLAAAPGEDAPAGPAAAVVGLSGVYDLRYETMRRLGFPFRRCCEQFLGGPYEDAAVQERAQQASPICHVPAGASGAAAAPRFLLLHGAEDPGVPVAQTQAMAARLRDCGGAVEEVLLCGAAHYILHERRQEVLARIMQFLADLDAPAPGATPGP